ncbi:DUF2711 family protein [Microvirga sp. 2YAF29]|uniref:DUF2711 family protein n=1 Tax=Microvirga sp. 2YAF29 TaxID=3233031 RepID=UPI003F9B2C8F
MAYIAFHPFVRIPGLDPADCEPWTMHVDCTAVPPEQNPFDVMKQLRDEQKSNFSPHVVGELLKGRGITLRWSEIGKAAGFDDPHSLNRALLSTIGALKREYEDTAGAERLSQYCSEEKIFMPTEGRFQSSMESLIAEVFHRAGYDQVEFADEFDESSSTIVIEKLRNEEPWSSINGFPVGARRIFTADRSLLTVVDWDSFFTLICGKAERLQHVALADIFEGFWCGPETTHQWWRQSSCLQPFRH